MGRTASSGQNKQRRNDFPPFFSTSNKQKQNERKTRAIGREDLYLFLFFVFIIIIFFFFVKGMLVGMRSRVSEFDLELVRNSVYSDE